MGTLNSALKAGVAGVVAVAAATATFGQSVQATIADPALDRWNYAFATSTFPYASCFSPFFSPFQSVFDNRDGEFLVGFNTAAAVPAGQPLTNYRIRSVKVVARIGEERGNAFRYDPTYDGFNTYLPTTPGFVPDADTGRPIELFGCGYRGAWTATTYTQTSPYTDVPQTSASLRNRNVYPIDQYTGPSSVRDVSNNVTEQFNVSPWALGIAQTNAFQTTVVNPGDLVPANTDFAFTLDLTNRDVIKYVRDGLAAGRLNVMITSLAITNQQATNVPSFYRRQYFVNGGLDPAYAPASLEVDVCVGAPADWDCNNQVSVPDIFAFLGDWFVGRGDFDADGQSTVPDIFAFLESWFSAQ